MSTAQAPTPQQTPPGGAAPPRKSSIFTWRSSRSPSFLAHGHPLLFLTGGALTIGLVMIAGLLVVVFTQGLATFWPEALLEVHTTDGKVYLGDVVREEGYKPEPDVVESLPPDRQEKIAQNGGSASRRLLQTANFDLTYTHHTWVSDFAVAEESYPEWATEVERLNNQGRFIGFPREFRVDGQVVASGPAEAWAEFEKHHGEVLSVGRQRAGLRKRSNELADDIEEKRKARADASAEQAEKARLEAELAKLDAEAARYQLIMATADGKEKALALADVARAYTPNRMGFLGKLGVYLGRWWEFLTDDPRNANTEGGVFPAIFGTFVMTIFMALAVVPFGVLAALYLREYARAGIVISVIRIAINNLAGVPSVVFGVFGLGFFCYLVGGGIDWVFFPDSYAAGVPVFKKGAVIWASLTLALLTLPVVIVATEEALVAVPRSLREGSYACGASKWQTIRRIVLPRAAPGILTGMILAMARGAGEVAPLMMVGLLKTAKALPIDGSWPFVHPSRSFMHLGYQIYDVGFQSQDSESAKPMVFTTTLLLIVLVAVLNLAAMWLRARLRRRFAGNQF